MEPVILSEQTCIEALFNGIEHQFMSVHNEPGQPHYPDKWNSAFDSGNPKTRLSLLLGFQVVLVSEFSSFHVISFFVEILVELNSCSRHILGWVGDLILGHRDRVEHLQFLLIVLFEWSYGHRGTFPGKSLRNQLLAGAAGALLDLLSSGHIEKYDYTTYLLLLIKVTKYRKTFKRKTSSKK